MKHPKSNRNRHLANPTVLRRQALNQRARVRLLPGVHPFGRRGLMLLCRSLFTFAGLTLAASAHGEDGPRIERVDRRSEDDPCASLA